MQAYLIFAWWLPYLEWCQRRYGDTFAVWAPPLGRIVYFADPADIKEVFTGDPTLLHAGEANAPFLEPGLGPSSLLVVDESRHLSDRKMMLPPFHGEAVRRYREMIAEVAAAEVASWPVGARFKTRPRMQAITLEVILRAVMGVTDSERLARLRPLLRRVAGITPVEQLMWLRPQLDRLPPWRGMRRVLDRADALLREEIAAHRADPALEQRTDVLSLLIRARSEDGRAMTDDDLRDELMTLLMAGHETTATGLAWAFERLVRNPTAMSRLVAEIEGGEEDRYLEAVVKETLRVRPVVADVIRKLSRDAEVQGYQLPAGTIVAPAIGLVQRSPTYWIDPLAFRPDRFLDGAPHPYTWIPFGGGVRRCIGAALAQLEMKVVLKTVLERVELAPARTAPEGMRVRHVTLVPSRGGEVVVTSRRRAPTREAAAMAAA
jgi:cytochrome P450